MTIDPSDASLLSIIATLIIAYKEPEKAKKYLDKFKQENAKQIAVDIIAQNRKNGRARSYLDWAAQKAGVYKKRCPHCDQILK